MLGVPIYPYPFTRGFHYRDLVVFDFCDFVFEHINMEAYMLGDNNKGKVTIYKISDLPQLVMDEQWDDVCNTLRTTGIHIKYSGENQARKRAQLNELRQLAYSVQRDMRAVAQDTGEIRQIIKGLSLGSNY